jgi:hypothetical protein
MERMRTWLVLVGVVGCSSSASFTADNSCYVEGGSLTVAGASLATTNCTYYPTPGTLTGDAQKIMLMLNLKTGTDSALVLIAADVNGAGAGDLSLVPWTYLDPFPDGVNVALQQAVSTFDAAPDAPGTAAMYVLRSSGGTPVKYKPATGKITVDAGSAWTFDRTGLSHVHMTFADVPLDATQTLAGQTGFSASIFKAPACSPTFSSGGSCMSTPTCNPSLHGQDCRSACESQTCAEVGVNRGACCVLDGGACTTNVTICCGGTCQSGTCISSGNQPARCDMAN